MALDPRRVGHSYPAYRYEISRAKIREYARAVGETDPRYVSDGDDMVALPTFAACFTVSQALQQVLDDPQLGAHTTLVHGSQSFTFGERAMRPGDVLTCVVTISDLTIRGDNEFLTLRSDCRYEDSGDLAVISDATLVFLGSAPGDAGAGT